MGKTGKSAFHDLSSKQETPIYRLSRRASLPEDGPARCLRAVSGTVPIFPTGSSQLLPATRWSLLPLPDIL